MQDPKLKERVAAATKLARHCRDYIWKRTRDLDEQGRYIVTMTAASILSVELMLDAVEGERSDIEDTLQSFTKLLRANLKEFIDEDDRPTQH